MYVCTYVCIYVWMYVCANKNQDSIDSFAIYFNTARTLHIENRWYAILEKGGVERKKESRFLAFSIIFFEPLFISENKPLLLSFQP
jgi:hypothetical protein